MNYRLLHDSVVAPPVLAAWSLDVFISNLVKYALLSLHLPHLKKCPAGNIILKSSFGGRFGYRGTDDEIKAEEQE